MADDKHPQTPSDERLVVLRNAYGFSTPFPLEFEDVFPHTGYYVDVSNEECAVTPLVGVTATTGGRFGNAFDACIRAIHVARSLGLSYVQFPDVEGLRNFEYFEGDGLTVFPASHPERPLGSFLRGPFELQHFAGKVPAISPGDRRTIVHSFIRRAIRLADVKPPRDELVIHIRSGDIFSTYIHSSYVQPPLSFYILVVERLFHEGRVSTVRVVHEDCLNPCVCALEQYLQDTGRAYKMQSSTFEDDLASMLDPAHFAFGFGTLGPSVCALSDQIETVHCFWGSTKPAGLYFHNAKEGFEYLPIGPYISIGEWKNSADQHQLMISFPAESIRRVHTFSNTS